MFGQSAFYAAYIVIELIEENISDNTYLEYFPCCWEWQDSQSNE